MPWIPNTQIAASGGALSLIEESILGAAGGFDFQNIPDTYRVLQIFPSARGDTAATFISVSLRFNADVGANYHREMIGYTSGTSAINQLAGQTEIVIQEVPAASAPASYFGAASFTVPYYATTDRFKAAYMELAAARGAGATTQSRFMGGGLWLSLAAINRVQLNAATGDFVATSRAALYGIT